MGTTTEMAHRSVLTDFLKLQLGVAAWFWLPYLLPSVLNSVWDHADWLGLLWWGVWFASPLVTLVGLLLLRRDWELPWAWLQTLVGTALAGSIWYQYSRIELG